MNYTFIINTISNKQSDIFFHTLILLIHARNFQIETLHCVGLITLRTCHMLIEEIAYRRITVVRKLCSRPEGNSINQQIDKYNTKSLLPNLPLIDTCVRWINHK